MGAEAAFTLIYAPLVANHVHLIDRKYHSLLRETIEQQLTYEPLNETRNRKPLQRPVEFGATWEIRFGSNNRFRVFYDVDETERTVTILAIGVKEGNRLKIGGEEIAL
ncbi:MAG TPA: type II toxin-antitoxin system RelE/ParE family toxin [Roseiflexaceae bacterium]|jgi:mRNA-degrading endonuclease RelE of RelBE toxin-antitoxin system|nr:type II toxin-antitoxin system RelE/ParE family toxin [Roseiflexaceae bacterium]